MIDEQTKRELCNRKNPLLVFSYPDGVEADHHHHRHHHHRFISQITVNSEQYIGSKGNKYTDNTLCRNIYVTFFKTVLCTTCFLFTEIKILASTANHKTRRRPDRQAIIHRR